jgi:hypothetical protein
MKRIILGCLIGWQLNTIGSCENYDLFNPLNPSTGEAYA